MVWVGNMYAPQLERFQRQLVLKFWYQIVSYYNSVVEKARELPHHLRLLWDGAFSFDDIYKPDSSFDVLKYLTVVLPTPKSDDIKINELVFDPYSISFPASNYSEDFNLLNTESFTADPDVYFLPVALEPPTPTTTQPLCLSFLVLVLFGLFTTYKSFSNRQNSRRRTSSRQDVVLQVPGKQTESDDLVTESHDTLEELREQLANIEQAHMNESRERDLEVAMLVAKAAELEEANDSKDQAIISLNADVSKANAETGTLRKSNEELTSQNKKYKEINYQYTNPKGKNNNNNNNQNSPSKGTPAAVVAPETSSKDKEIIAAKTAKTSKLEREAVGLHEQIQAKTAELQSKEIEVRASEPTHKKEKDALQRECQTLRREKTILITEKDKVVVEKRSLETEVTKLQEEREAKDAMIAEIKSNDVSKELLKQMYHSSSESNKKLLQSNTDLRNEIAEKNVDVDQCNLESQKLIQSNTKLHAELTEKGVELRQAKQETDELKEKLAILETKSETRVHGTQTDEDVNPQAEEAKAGPAVTISEQAAVLDQIRQEKDELETKLFEKDDELQEASQDNCELEAELFNKDKQLNEVLDGNAVLDSDLVEQRQLVNQWVQFYESIRWKLETSEQATQSANEQGALEVPVEDEDLEQVVEDARTMEALEEDIPDQAPVIRLPSTSGPYVPIVNHNVLVKPEPPAEPQEADTHQRSAKNVFPKPQKNLPPKEVARRKADKEYCYPAPLNVIIWINGTDMQKPLKVVYKPQPYLMWGQGTSTTVVSASQKSVGYEDEKPMQGLEASRWVD